jgi:hypothetical protein
MLKLQKNNGKTKSAEWAETKKSRSFEGISSHLQLAKQRIGRSIYRPIGPSEVNNPIIVIIKQSLC